MSNEYFKINKRVDQIIKKVCFYMKGLNNQYIKDEIMKAYEYAKKAHEGQYRHSGDPYIIHPVEATFILLDLKPDIYTIQACFLHDVIEDTPKTDDDIRKEFGDEVAFLCVGMEKLSKIKYQGQERDVGSLRKMLIAMTDDLRVIFIKLADRLHNMKTLKYHPKAEKREKIALETLNIYSPVADRLGLYNFKNDLDEECLKILDKRSYLKLKKELKNIENNLIDFSENAQKEIYKILDGQIKNFKVDYRIKSMYSIYKKLQKKDLNSASELYDLFGIRVIVDTVTDCYKVLGLIHNKWSPVPSRFKDYIALPKPNGYKSLHTNIIGFLKQYRKQPTEIQIKTYEMLEYSNLGVAAHFEYKERGSKISKDIYWVKELKELTSTITDNDFVGSLKVDVFKNRIFVFTPNGDSINLPAGSTPIDFAYSVHSDLGDHITLAKVNNKVYPLDKELSNGDVVEIIIDKNKKPNPFWISFVKTVKAKNRIKSFLKKEDRELHIERGKDIMNKYLEKAGLCRFDKDYSILKNYDGKVNTIEERLTLLEYVGTFSLNPSSIIKKILKSPSLLKKYNKDKCECIESHNKTDFCINNTKKKDIKKIEKPSIIIGGEKGLAYKLCYCSRRKIPKEIVAHINSKGIITIHNRNCKILESVNTERLLPAYIEGTKEEKLLVKLNLIFKNKIGILKELTEIIYSMGIDIDYFNTKKLANGNVKFIIDLIILDFDYLLIDRFIDRLRIHFNGNLISSEVEKIKK